MRKFKRYRAYCNFYGQRPQYTHFDTQEEAIAKCEEWLKDFGCEVQVSVMDTTTKEIVKEW